MRDVDNGGQNFRAEGSTQPPGHLHTPHRYCTCFPSNSHLQAATLLKPSKRLAKEALPLKSRNLIRRETHITGSQKGGATSHPIEFLSIVVITACSLHPFYFVKKTFHS